VAYKTIGIRNNYSATDKKLTDYIDSKINQQSKPDVEALIKLGLSITSDQLYFTANKSNIDPNKLITSKKAHCVGYASFFATTCNYLLNKYGLANIWTAKVQIGQLYFLGINVHKYFSSSFLKDHDFVLIENRTTGQIFAVDPTVNDYLYVDLITYNK
jgi:hypothetical protein